MQPPAADDPPVTLALVVADRREEVDELAATLTPGQPRTERVPQEREALVLVGAAARRVLAVHDAGLVLVELKPALRQPLSDRGPQLPGLAFACGVDNHVIAIALEPHARVFPGEPRVERVMQEHVGEQGRDRRTLRSSAIPLDQTAV